MSDKDETKITAAQDEILTVDEAAALLKLHKTTVHKLALARENSGVPHRSAMAILPRAA